MSCGETEKNTKTALLITFTYIFISKTGEIYIFSKDFNQEPTVEA